MWIYSLSGTFQISLIFLTKWFLIRWFLKDTSIFSQMSPFSKMRTVTCTILNFLYPKMLNDMFGWIWLIGSSEEKTCKLYGQMGDQRQAFRYKNTLELIAKLSKTLKCPWSHFQSASLNIVYIIKNRKKQVWSLSAF